MSSITHARIVRRRAVRVAAAALTATAALSLTACSGADAKAAKPAGQAGASTGSVGAEGGASGAAGMQGADKQEGKTTSGSGEAKSGAGEANSSRVHAGSGGAKGGGKSTFCRTSDLVMEADNSSRDEKEGEITVQMTSKAGSVCSVTGFAGVDLKDADGTSAPVHRGGEVPRITNLKPGDTATFSISYKVDLSGDSLTSPTNIMVTPPNETHSVSLKWPADALKLGGSYDETIKVHPVGIAS
ncbi:DUF4232 domain-containing protein [Streptomyces sp. WZ-12]|uniref:DUF4232 domain-containing protein n=1 Tax=Streptomyces sp. WZ-12 TaxID=3030210 RepID=UPI0023811D9F|nr:DUF4232 domain-containing protein [Streptomyces sp. WZ-12]